MTFQERFAETCEKLILYGSEYLLVGVSGGADSMCLLSSLCSLRDCRAACPTGVLPFPKIIVCHVNHLLRGSDSDADEAFVKDFCKQKAVIFRSVRYDVRAKAKADSTGLEETGRRLRYEFFYAVADEYSSAENPVQIAVAHHRDDAAETILMNLFRGAGPDGLVGIRPQAGRIIRPLLSFSRGEIEETLRENQIPYRIDASNFENEYFRNYIRNDLIPSVARASGRNPAEALLSLSEIVLRDKEYFDEAVQELLREEAVFLAEGWRTVSCRTLNSKKPAISARLVRALYEDTFGCKTDLTAVHIDSILTLSLRESNGKSISLPGKRIAHIDGGFLFFTDEASHSLNQARFFPLSEGGVFLTPANSDNPLYFELFPEQFVSVPKTSILAQVYLVENPQQLVYNNRTWYCEEKELSGVILRNPEPGDVFHRAGGNGGKPLRRYFSDQKIPSSLRPRIILAAKGREVLWIPGLSHAIGFTDAVSANRFRTACGNRYENPEQHVKMVGITLHEN